MEKKFKPFFKWSGGKSKEFNKVVDWMPDSYGTYYEPFVGGGAVWLGLNPQKAVIGDFYDEVTNFYNILKVEGQSFIDECNEVFKNKIDILINNAGITSDNLTIRMKEEEWNRVINLNLTSTFLLTKNALKKTFPSIKYLFSKNQLIKTLFDME